MLEKATMSYLLRETAAEMDDSQAYIKRVVTTFFQIVQDELAEGNSVVLSPYVKFDVKVSPAIKKGAMVKNPFTGETAPSPGKAASLRLSARALSGLKRALPDPSSKDAKAIVSALGAKKAAA
jgi:nucleoid DNA-binding protein